MARSLLLLASLLLALPARAKDLRNRVGVGFNQQVGASPAGGVSSLSVRYGLPTGQPVLNVQVEGELGFSGGSGGSGDLYTGGRLLWGVVAEDNLNLYVAAGGDVEVEVVLGHHAPEQAPAGVQVAAAAGPAGETQLALDLHVEYRLAGGQAVAHRQRGDAAGGAGADLLVEAHADAVAEILGAGGQGEEEGGEEEQGTGHRGVPPEASGLERVGRLPRVEPIAREVQALRASQFSTKVRFRS